MASLSYGDILKRDNIEKLVGFINSKSSMAIGAREGGEMLRLTGKVRYDNTIESKLDETEIRLWFENKRPSDKFEIETKEQRYVVVTKFFKSKDFGGVAAKAGGAGTERQEEGIIIHIRDAVKANGPVKMTGLPSRIKIKDSAKNEGLSSIGQEPYIDVNLIKDNGKMIGCSMKGTSAPSLAGGGLAGLNVVVPHLPPLVYEAIVKHLKSEGHGQGETIDNKDLPDLYIPVPPEDTRLILEGNAKMGGPIEYMYIGPMDVTSTFKNGTLTLNGNFYSIDDYMRKIPQFYFRVRKRDLDPDNMVKIEYVQKNKEGFPRIYTSPRTGRNHLRIVIVDKVPATGKLLNL